MHSDSVPLASVKRATNQEDIQRLRIEAVILQRAAQPGVIQLVSQRFGPDVAELTLAPLTGQPIAQARLEAHRLAVTMTALAMVIHRLHERGITHNGISGTTIWLDQADGRPVITDFTHSTAAPTPEALTTAAKAIDIRALNSLLGEKLSQLRKVDSNNAGIESVRKRLDQIVQDWSTREDNRAFDAREWASAVRATTVEGAPVRRGAPAARHNSNEVDVDSGDGVSALDRLASMRTKFAPTTGRFNSYLRSAPALALGKVAGVFIVVVALIFGIHHFTTGASAFGVDPSVPKCPDTGTAPLIFDVDGNGCSDAVTLGDGTVKINADTYTVGQSGDLLAIGRWTCSDRRTLALLSPASGQLYIFDKWPGSGQDVTPKLIATVPNAAAIAASPNGSCDDVAVTSAAGTKIIDPQNPAPTTTTTTIKKKR